jgi:hypothetical protein
MAQTHAIDLKICRTAACALVSRETMVGAYFDACRRFTLAPPVPTMGAA